MDIELHVSDGDVGRFFGVDFPRPRLYGNVMKFTANRSPDLSEVIRPQAARVLGLIRKALLIFLLPATYSSSYYGGSRLAI
jgi:hypothetical protein